MADHQESSINVRHPSVNGTNIDTVTEWVFEITDRIKANMSPEETLIERVNLDRVFKIWCASRKVSDEALYVTIGRCRRVGNGVKNWFSELWYELTRKEESERAKFDVQASNLVAFQKYLSNLTSFQRDVDALIKSKFGIPRIENSAANNSAMRIFLFKHFKSTCPTMRTKDVETHITEAIARAYIPTQRESIIVSTARDIVYQTINENYHGETNIIDYVNTNKLSKLYRIYRLFFGKPAYVNLSQRRLIIAKQHNTQYSKISFETSEVQTPDFFGELDPLAPLKKPDPVLEQNETQPLEPVVEESIPHVQSQKKYVNRSRAGIAKDINLAPGEIITTLEQS